GGVEVLAVVVCGYGGLVTREALADPLQGVVEVSRQQARGRRFSEDEVGALRAVAGDAGGHGGVAEVPADPVLRAPPASGAGAGVTGGTVVSRAVRRVIEGRILVRRARPAGGRRRPFALVAGQAARRCRAPGEMEATAGPGGE